MQTVTEFVLRDLASAVEQAQCGVFVSPLSQVRFQVFVHARNGLGGMKVVMDWELDPTLATAAVKCYVGSVNPQAPKAKADKVASFGFHELCGEKYVAMKSWLAESLKPVKPEVVEEKKSYELPSEVLEAVLAATNGKVAE